MQELNNKESEQIHLNLDKTQIIFVLHLGFIFILPLLGGTVFNQVKQIYQYTQEGSFVNDCSMFKGFDNTELVNVCRSDNIIMLVGSFGITTSMFLFMANKVRKFIIGALINKHG